MKRLILAVILAVSVPVTGLIIESDSNVGIPVTGPSRKFKVLGTIEADQESALRLYERLRNLRYERQEQHYQILHKLVTRFTGGKTIVDSVQVQFRAADLPKLRARAVKRLQRIKKLARAEVALCDSLLGEWK